MDTKEYREYLNKKGDSANKVIKNSIYFDSNKLNRLSVIEYIIDTLENYNYIYCKDSIYDRVDIITTEPIDGERDGFVIETKDRFIVTEGNIKKYLYDINKIERYLNDILNDKLC